MVVAEGSEWDERKLYHDTSLWYPEFHQDEGSHWKDQDAQERG